MEMKVYKVKIKLEEDLLGAVPKDPDVYSKYVASKCADAGLVEEEIATVESLSERGWTGFHRDERGAFLYDYSVRGFLKESAAALKQWGVMKQLLSKINKYVWVRPRKVRLPEPSGAFERPLRAMTAQGPRTCLVKSDIVKSGSEIEFEIHVHAAGGITRGCIEELLSRGQYQGLGQFRSGSFGSFSVIEFVEL